MDADSNRDFKRRLGPEKEGLKAFLHADHGDVQNAWQIDCQRGSSDASPSSSDELPPDRTDELWHYVLPPDVS